MSGGLSGPQGAYGISTAQAVERADPGDPRSQVTLPGLDGPSVGEIEPCQGRAILAMLGGDPRQPVRVFPGKNQQTVGGTPGGVGNEPGDRVKLGPDNRPQFAPSYDVFGTAMLGQHAPDPLGSTDVGSSGRVGMRYPFAQLWIREPMCKVLCVTGDTTQFFGHLQPFNDPRNDFR